MFPFQRLVRRFTFMGPPEPVEAPIVHVRQQLLGRYIKSEILENFLKEIFEELSDDFEMEVCNYSKTLPPLANMFLQSFRKQEVDSEYWAVRVPRLLTEVNNPIRGSPWGIPVCWIKIGH